LHGVAQNDRHIGGAGANKKAGRRQRERGKHQQQGQDGEATRQAGWQGAACHGGGFSVEVRMAFCTMRERRLS
jgi:hypothetical protein